MAITETATAEQIAPTEVPSETTVRDAAQEVVHSLDEILMPNGGGEVRFGAENEALRLSQVEALTATRNCVAEGVTLGHIVQPGGTGKTREGIVAAHAMHRHKRNTLFVVPSQQAVEDFAQKARELCPDLDVGTVYQVEKRIGRLTFITYASLLRCILGETAEAEAQNFEQAQENEDASASVSPSTNGQKFTVDPADYDLVLWDEGHKYLTTNAQQLLARFGHAINVALTATPRYYEGKEVANVFGQKIHELSLATAVERKEISDFRNMLITTDVTTGLELSSPDQEESAEVARAIDIPNRNRIFPDMYLNARIKVGEKEFTLAGEPTIVFGAGIDHVHDLAQAFNDVLSEALQNNEEFRAALRTKGIDPDKVEQIAAPIHSGGSETHSPMQLNARNELVARYHERKVLVLVATSVLQQSFDSPITSVVIDSVPRQTYVGVGQAGMRSLRWLANKEMAFIINTQDADHPSLTFLDFQGNRGREEGVAVEIGHTNGTEGRRRATTTGGGGTTANYDVTYGASLLDLAERRRAQNGQLYREDHETSSRHFTALGFQRVNKLILDIAGGSQEAASTFMEVLQPWIARTQLRIVPQVFGNTNVDEETLADAASDTLFSLIATVQSGGIQGWSRFSTRFQQDLRRRYEDIQRDSEGLSPLSLDEDIPHVHVQTHLRETDPRELVAMNEPTEVSFHETIPSRDLEESDPSEMQDKIGQVLKTLTYREREVVKLRYGIADGHTYTLEEVGRVFKVTRSRIREIEAKALRKLRHPVRSRQLEMYVNQDRPIPVPKRDDADMEMQANEEQRRRNNQILWEIEDDLVAQKQIIFDILRCGCDWVPTTTIEEKTGVSEKYTKPLSDLEWTRVNDLIVALDDGMLTQLTANLHRLGVSSAKALEFDDAISELKLVMARFTQMGGKPVKASSEDIERRY